MKKRITTFLLVMCSMLLSGCSLVNSLSLQFVNEETLIDYNQMRDEIASKYLGIFGNDFSADYKSCYSMEYTVTVDDKYIYFFPEYKINLENGMVEEICSIPGCDHTISNERCIKNRRIVSPVATEEGIYYSDQSGLWLLSYGQDSVMKYKRDVLTNYEQMTGTRSAAALFCNRNKIIMVYANSFQIYDRDTNSVSEMFELNIPGVIWGTAGNDELLMFLNDTNELFIYEYKSQNVLKIADHITCVKYIEGIFYCTQYENNMLSLYRYDLDSGRMDHVIDDCYVSFQIVSDYLFYQRYSDYQMCCMNLRTKEIFDYDIKIYDDKNHLVKPQVYFLITAKKYLDSILFIDSIREENNKVFEVFFANLSDYKNLKNTRLDY